MKSRGKEKRKTQGRSGRVNPLQDRRESTILIGQKQGQKREPKTRSFPRKGRLDPPQVETVTDIDSLYIPIFVFALIRLVSLSVF